LSDGRHAEIFGSSYPCKEHFATGPVVGFAVRDLPAAVGRAERRRRVDGHQNLPSDGHEVSAIVITESDRTCWSPRCQLAAERRFRAQDDRLARSARAFADHPVRRAAMCRGNVSDGAIIPASGPRCKVVPAPPLMPEGGLPATGRATRPAAPGGSGRAPAAAPASSHPGNDAQNIRTGAGAITGWSEPQSEQIGGSARSQRLGGHIQ
jgi:hypothetical protein